MKIKNIEYSDIILQKLPPEFYFQETRIIANNLIGKLLVHNDNGNLLAGEIVETEAYLNVDDMASHSAPGLTKRNEPMFLSGGHSYIYLIYGINLCFNIVTEKEGKGCAVLIRALKPIYGIDIMIKNRGVNNIVKLCKGPGNLTKAMGIGLDLNRADLRSENLFISEYKIYNEIDIGISKRIGIIKSSDLEYRYFLKNSEFVSGKKQINSNKVTQL